MALIVNTVTRQELRCYHEYMKYVFRLFWLLLTQSRRSRCEVTGPCISNFRVLPNDLDVLMHMNNGVYLTMADLARVDLLLRSDAFHRVRKNGWYPVVAGETIRFRKSLKLWQPYSISTRVVAWTEKSIFLEQTFTSGDTFVARAIIDARFLSRRGGVVTSTELLDFLNLKAASPPVPAWIQNWSENNQ